MQLLFAEKKYNAPASSTTFPIELQSTWYNKDCLICSGINIISKFLR